MHERLSDAFASMTRRQLEETVRLGQLELQACVLCHAPHADDYLTYPRSNRGKRASIRLCPACFDKHRLPEGRATA